MNRIWAPWRIKYLLEDPKKNKGCLFCRFYRERSDKRNFVLFRTDHCFVVMNIYPYNNGHLLVVPNRHVNDTHKLKDQERCDLWAAVETSKALLKEVINPEGFNVGINIGKVAGAGIPGHVHVHIVPRWGGDVNFMPVVAQTKVISQSLKELYGALHHTYKKRH
ncbi:MAG: HIT domain-containing protein [Candidatus Omnitrophica bacterium]|nr:HIT domain-containing protein [Candidatus Omnitrophota bacterium]